MKTVRWDGYPTEIVPPLEMRTVKKAIAEMKRQIALKLKGRNGGEPYKRLPRGHKILS